MNCKYARSGRYQPRLKRVVLGGSFTGSLENVWKIEAEMLEYIEGHPLCKTTDAYQRLRCGGCHALRALHRLCARGAVDTFRGGNAEGKCGAATYARITPEWSAARLRQMRALQESHRGNPVLIRLLLESLSAGPASVAELAEKTEFSRSAVARHVQRFMGEGRVVVADHKHDVKLGRAPVRYVLVGTRGDDDSTIYVYRKPGGASGPGLAEA